MTISGGTKFKVLEAMASGVPVISTRKGVEGIDCQKIGMVLIAKSSQSFVENFCVLITIGYFWIRLPKDANACRNVIQLGLNRKGFGSSMEREHMSRSDNVDLSIVLFSFLTQRIFYARLSYDSICLSAREVIRWR